MKIKDLCSYAPKSRIKAGEAVENAKYLFFTSSTDENKRYTDFQFDKEGIIMGTGGNATLHYYNGKFSVSTDCLVLFPNSKIKCKYLYYFFKSHMSVLEAGFKGAGLKHTNKKYIEEINVSKVPDLTTQEKIVSHLDTITENIEKLNRELELFDSLTKARFIEMFGDPYTNPLKWEKLKIKDAVTVEPQNGLYKPQSDYVTDRSGIPILRIDGFYDGIVTDFASLKRLKCSETEKQKYLLLEDDIVINRVNSIEYLGKCAHIKGLLEDTVYESNMMRMHFDPESYNPAYICKLLCSQFIYDQIVNHAKKAVNQASINQKDVLDFNIYQPPIDLQNQFSDFVRQVDKSREAVKKSLEKTQQLYDSLMQEYFG